MTAAAASFGGFIASRVVLGLGEGAVVITKADAKFVKEVKDKTAPLEQAWVKAAEGKGLKNPAKVLADFRAEIIKLEK